MNTLVHTWDMVKTNNMLLNRFDEKFSGNKLKHNNIHEAFSI